MDSKTHRLGAAALAAAILATACSDGTGVGDPASVSLNFRVGSGSAAPAAAPGGPSRVAGPPMTIDGTNGSLTIDEVRLIVAEAELEPIEHSCEPGTGELDDDSCPEFEALPRFLDLPLDGMPVSAFTAVIPAGTYDELEFEVEDLEDDEESPAEAAAIATVRAAILAEFPEWPREASALVVGSFTPAGGGGAISFRVFLEAEIEIELDLIPPVVVGGDGASSRDLTVDVRPDVWFGLADGTVLPLHLYDWDTTGSVLEFEVEMEDGFTEIEIG